MYCETVGLAWRQSITVEEGKKGGKTETAVRQEQRSTRWETKPKEGRDAGILWGKD